MTKLVPLFGFIGMNEVGLPDTIGRYDFTPIIATTQEALGDRTEHSIKCACRGEDGTLKDAAVTAVSISEWDGPRGTQLASVGTHRARGGCAVEELLEGASSIVGENDKAVGGGEGSGKAVFKFASGAVAPPSGKTVTVKNQADRFWPIRAGVHGLDSIGSTQMNFTSSRPSLSRFSADLVNVRCWPIDRCSVPRWFGLVRLCVRSNEGLLLK
ncbi:hypothetical protein [Bradyrhizobium sp. Tv2a-2]|uniref:hypothetical protein n=1 Tax=Bradyrhizobium sp. Tv2a-2 TaxID=113395 RepID=UPI0006885388|nr:hypothetical protein [Bradyrhizobium sp. Tv2a-2]